MRRSFACVPTQSAEGEIYTPAIHTREYIDQYFFVIFLRFRGVHHAFAKILAEGGIRGLWAGWVPNIQRAALVNMGGNELLDSLKPTSPSYGHHHPGVEGIVVLCRDRNQQQ